jgi:alkylmercury lyase-like protein
MCAIDALGIPQMPDRDATIIATDASTGDEVRVETNAGRWQWTPPTTAVLVAQTGTSGPSAECTCGHVNFYSHAEQAQAHLDGHPELTGRVLDQSTAVELAGGVFGGLLRNPASTTRRGPAPV